MTTLQLGATPEGKGAEVALDGCLGHSVVLGQSGSGKSSFLARLLEELIIKSNSRVFLFDLNSEFTQFWEAEHRHFGDPEWNKRLCPLDLDADAFREEWKLKLPESQFCALGAYQTGLLDLKIPVSSMTSDDLCLFLNLKGDANPAAVRFLNALVEGAEDTKVLKSRRKVEELATDVHRWSQGRLKSDERRMSSALLEMAMRTDSLELARLMNGLGEIARCKEMLFEDDDSGGVSLDRGFFEDISDGRRRFVVVDLLSFLFDEARLRSFITYICLKGVWDEAQRRFRDQKFAGGREARPVFVVVDEAHNLAAAPGAGADPLDAAVSRLLRKIASEGRKFGVFLVLVTQRPEKIDSFLVSECVNAFVMKSNLASVDALCGLLPMTKIESTFLKDLGPERFGVGEVVLWGSAVRPGFLRFSSSIKRTA